MATNNHFDQPASTSAASNRAQATADAARERKAATAAENAEIVHERVIPSFTPRNGIGNMSRLFTRDSVGDVSTNLVANIKAIISAEPQSSGKKWLDDGTIAFIDVPTRNGSLKFGTVIGVYHFTSEQNEEVALAIPLIMNSPDLQLDSVHLQNNKTPFSRNGDGLSMPYSASDAFYTSVDYRNELIEHVSKVYPTAGVILPGVMALQLDQVNLDPNTAEGNHAIRSIIYRLVEALQTQSYELMFFTRDDSEIFSITGANEVDVTGNRRGTYNIEVGVDYPQVQTGKTALGDTFRQVFTITSVAHSVNEGVRQIGPSIYGETSSPQTFLACYPDLIYMGTDAANVQMYGPSEYNRVIGNTASFMGAVNISMVDTERNGVTPAQLLFAISQSSIVIEKSAWTFSLRPEILSRSGEHNFGAVGIWIPESGQPLLTNPNSLRYSEAVPENKLKDPAEFVNFVKETIRVNEGVSVHLDFNEANMVTPALLPIYNVAVDGHLDNTGEATPSQLQILNSLDEVYNQNFTRRWNDAGRPALFVTSFTRIPAGTYIGKDNTVRDIREIDMIWMMQNCQDDKIISEFNSAMYSSEYSDSQYRTLRIHQILRELVPSYKKTGMVTRISVTPAFFELCARCTVDVGASIRPSGLNDVFRDNSTLRVVNYNTNFAVGQDSITGMYRGNFHNGNNQMNATWAPNAVSYARNIYGHRG